MLSASGVQTLSALFFHHVDRYHRRELLVGQTGQGHVSYSSARFRTSVIALAGYFAERGVRPGDRVAILAGNRPEWHVADFAVMLAGLVSVPLYTAFSAAQIRYVLEQSGASVLVVSGRDVWDAIAPALRGLPDLRIKISMEESLAGADGGFVSLASVEANRAQPANFEDSLRERAAALPPATLATIVYTSGTTGLPKGVMLSHGNLAANLDRCLQRLDIPTPQQALSVLPLAHVFERLVCYGYFFRGVPIAYGDPHKLVELMSIHRPDVIGVVPRILERVREAVLEQIENANPRQRTLGRWLLAQGLAHGGDGLLGRQPTVAQRLTYPLVQALLFSKVHRRLGGRLRHIVCGGARLDPRVEEFFYAAGFHILQGYGLTETSPVVSLTPVGAAKPGTVGKPLDGVQVRFSEDGELLVKGPNVMLGYYHDAAQTDAILDCDGWLHTGDLARLDEHGYLQITGRKKEILVTSGGKNICPDPIEHELRKSPLIQQVMLVGDGRKYLSALVVANYARVCQRVGIAPDTPGLADDLRVRAVLWQEIEGRQSSFAAWEQVKKFVLLEEKAFEDPHLLTPTQKLRRRQVEDRFRNSIEELYSADRWARAPVP